MKGIIVAVTGANDGIGFETAKGLVGLGATVILACRDEQKCNDAKGKTINFTFSIVNVTSTKY